MKLISPILLGLSFAVVGGALAAAQEMQAPAQEMQMQGPPKVVQITREFIKPGKSGAIHDKSESNFVQAMARAKWPTHYFAMNSLSGKSRALYLTGYPSFEAWEKDNAAVEKNTALSAELDRYSVADGELLDGLDQVVLYYNEELSYRPVSSLAHVRFMEVTVFKIKPGHRKDFSDAIKMVMDANKKGGTSANWAMFEVAYGGGDEYALFSPYKSMADIDKGEAEEPKFMEVLGESGRRRPANSAEAIDSDRSELTPSIPPRATLPKSGSRPIRISGSQRLPWRRPRNLGLPPKAIDVKFAADQPNHSPERLRNCGAAGSVTSCPPGGTRKRPDLPS